VCKNSQNHQQENVAKAIANALQLEAARATLCSLFPL